MHSGISVDCDYSSLEQLGLHGPYMVLLSKWKRNTGWSEAFLASLIELELFVFSMSTALCHESTLHGIKGTNLSTVSQTCLILLAEMTTDNLWLKE